MRSQVPNLNQESRSGNEQKKSVFDRLGRQLDTGRSMNRRSPTHYGEHLPPPAMHEPDFGRYGREPHMEIDWRYQNHDRRHMMFSRDRHPPSHMAGPLPPQPPPPPPPHYELDPQNRPPQYYPHPHPYHDAPPPPRPTGPPMGLGGMSGMGMHQRRPSPKYDRHGNLIRGMPMRMEQHPNIPPPRDFIPPGPMMMPGSYEMPPMRPNNDGMYPPHPRWAENMDMGPPMLGTERMLPEFMEPPRFQQPMPQQPPPMMNPPEAEGIQHMTGFEVPRYAKWRERRDVITNLDRETAQSSSRTDSLKSSLQQTDQRGHNKRQEFKGHSKQASKSARKGADTNESASPAVKASNTSNSETNKTITDPQDISDGEIIDDEDSSDESDVAKMTRKGTTDFSGDDFAGNQLKALPLPYDRSGEGQPYYESAKRRRIHEDCSMDYETISDDELDVFMSEKKSIDDSKAGGHQGAGCKSSSEIELLNALGLDWANLIELSRQSRKEANTTGSARFRFSMSNYLPTLGISRELAGPKLYELILKVGH